MEILQNSIIKLVVRQGSDLDRQTIVLGSGELGYTTDTNRLFVGDGFLSGGNVVGNLFKGSQPTITNVALWPSTIGDTAFASDTNKLYALQSGVGSNLSDWLLIGGVYTSGDDQIAIADDNVVTLNPLSANYISNDAILSPLYLSSGRVGVLPLSANQISDNALSPRLSVIGGKVDLLPISANYISTNALSSPLVLNGGKIALSPLSAYNISQNAIKSPLIIEDGKIALSATIPYDYVTGDKLWQFDKSFNVTVGGDVYNDTPFNPLAANILVKSSQQYARYDALSGVTSFEKGGTMDTLSTGHYRFTFTDAYTTLEYIPMAQILGLNALSYQARVTNITLSSCDVEVVNSSGNKRDANIVLKIDQ